jgi:hypothetical protein
MRRAPFSRLVALILGASLILVVALVALLTQQVTRIIGENNLHATRTAVARLTQPYHASPSPGPNCDKNGATWDDAGASPGVCRADGYRLGTGGLLFGWFTDWRTGRTLPPNTLPTDQQVDMRVTFKPLRPTPTPYTSVTGEVFEGFSACIYLEMRGRFGTAERYYFEMCNNGIWTISRVANPSWITLASGRIPQHWDTFTLGASCVGSTLTLTVNGAIVGHANDASDASVTSGGNLVSVGVSQGFLENDIVISDFTFTPVAQ